MDGNEEGDGWGDIDPGDSVWEQEAASLSMFEPPPFTAGFCDIWEFRVGLGRRFSALAREQGGGGEGQGIRGQRGKRWGELCDTPVVTAWGGAFAPWLPEGPQLLFGPSRRARRQAPPKIPHLSLGDRRHHCQRGAPRGHRGGPGEPSDRSKMIAPGRCLLPLLSPCLFPVAGGCPAASGILGHTMHTRPETPSTYRLGGCA